MAQICYIITFIFFFFFFWPDYYFYILDVTLITFSFVFWVKITLITYCLHNEVMDVMDLYLCVKIGIGI